MYAGLKLLVGVPSVAPELPAQRPWVRKDKAMAVDHCPYIRVDRALVCLDCDSVFCADDGRSCPSCASAHSWPLSAWVNRR